MSVVVLFTGWNLEANQDSTCPWLQRPTHTLAVFRGQAVSWSQGMIGLMWDTTSRTFELLGMLQRSGFVASERLAADLGVTTRTVRRDVARLRDLGYPIDTRLGVDGGYSVEPGAVLPPIFLSTDEALACAVALRKGEKGTDPTLAAIALRKVVGSLPPRTRWIVEAMTQVTVDAPVDGLEPTGSPAIDLNVLGELARACVLRRRVGFLHTQRAGGSKARRVDPHALVNTVHRWYLVGFDIDTSEWRTYRVDRITGVEVTHMLSGPPAFPSSDVEGWVTQQLRMGWQQVTATVRVHAPAVAARRWVAPAWGIVEHESADTAIVRAGADSYESIARWLLLVQADVDVLEPEQLRAAFKNVATQALRTAERLCGPARST